MNKLLLVVLAALVSTQAFAANAPSCDAGTPSLSWTLPTKNTDGTNVASTGTLALRDTRIYLDGATTPIKIVPMPATTFQFSLGDITGGAHTFKLTVTNSAATANESAPTNAVGCTIPTTPGQVSGVTIN